MLCVTCSYATPVVPLGTKQEDGYKLRPGKETGVTDSLGSKGPSWVYGCSVWSGLSRLWTISRQTLDPQVAWYIESAL